MATRPSFIKLCRPVANRKAPYGIFPVEVVGSAAERALSLKSQWQVLAVFRRSIYLRNSEEAVVCLGPREFGAGPLNVLCELPLQTDWLSTGIGNESTVACDDRLLSVDARFWFSFERSTVWVPPASSSGWSLESLDQGLKIIAAEANRRCPAEGLAPLIPVIIKMPDTFPNVVTPLACMAWKPIVSLFDWLKKEIAREKNAPSTSIRQEMKCLVGLGPGLTPSGDDFLGGVLIALHATGHKDAAGKLAEELLPPVRNRTNVISAALLASAAKGEGNAAVHRILSAINGQNTQRLIDSLGIMDTVGHSSGWDAVAGLALALKAYAESFSNWRYRYRLKIDKAAWAKGLLNERLRRLHDH